MASFIFQIILPIALIIGLLVSSVQSPRPPEALAQVSNWQKGVTIEPSSPTEFSGDAFRQSMTSLAQTGANFVALIIPYYQSSTNAVDLAPGWNTPTDQSLADGINTIHSLGMKVMLKMHPEVKDGNWRGEINPDDRAGWFSTYGDILERYSTLAQQNGVEQICLGAEMFKLTSPSANPTNTENWNNLIDRVKGKYSGSLTYSAQHTYPREAEEIEFWNRLDYIGFAAYWALAAADPNPSLETLKNAWNDVNQQAVSPLAQKWGKPVLFTEIGYRSMDNTHADPWDWGRSGNANEAEQAANYEALFSYWNDQPYMAGVYFWKWESNPSAGGPGDTGYTPQNKQAQQTMTTWFGGLAGLTPTPTGEPTPTPTQEPTPTEGPTPTPSEEPESTPTPTSEPTATPTETPATPTETPPAPVTPTVSPTLPHWPSFLPIAIPEKPSPPEKPAPPERPSPPAIPDLSDLMNLFSHGE